MAKRSMKGLPKAVQGLARAGQRFRLPGTWLYDTKRDRAIADWLNEVSADPTVNVSEMVKDYLYKVASSSENQGDPILDALHDVQRQLEELRKRVILGVATPTEQAIVNNAENVLRQLKSLPD